MIKSVLDNEILSRLIAIENRRSFLSGITLPASVSNRLRKNTKKKSSYASNHIEGNPLSEEQSANAIESQSRHLLNPEQEIRNYYLAINLLEDELARKTPFSKKLILDVQKQVVYGASPEKIGIRGPMPPGFLFAVYDEKTGNPDYIPPESCDINPLLEELISYVNTSDDHPVIKAAIVHYQMVTIHPFEDGNGRTARLLSSYILEYYGYGFKQIGTIDEYFAYDIDEYYNSLQMGLPAVYYEGRENPPHPEIWIRYFVRMMDLYTAKVLETAKAERLVLDRSNTGYLNNKEMEFWKYLSRRKIQKFRPVDLAKVFGVSSRTIINWSTKLCSVGLLKPVLVNKRITAYVLEE